VGRYKAWWTSSPPAITTLGQADAVDDTGERAAQPLLGRRRSTARRFIRRSTNFHAAPTQPPRGRLLKMDGLSPGWGPWLFLWFARHIAILPPLSWLADPMTNSTSSIVLWCASH
jgi:hypothetical protein